ncbi:MarR family transcriptional regulator [Picosynechococcus sp. PCC 8807]|uniref:MarR family transcriptional regulator n=1 Tax=Picosynechococcus sp. PCC 8807 TaxID=195248 RepID=UPI000810B28E|nr:helix-turn-helix domain-containing protein [Picosynechococcus sp. PCC 8807]ANV92094.1 hypothetical protein AWQ24_15050 [Picosynechococcus sp. PCC 8807]
MNNISCASPTSEKFYKLTESEYRAALQLKPAERDLLFYLRVRDPFGDGLEINVAEIAEELGRHRATINSALNVLRKQGWLEHGFKTVRTIALKTKEAIAEAVQSVQEAITPTSNLKTNPPEDPKNFTQIPTQQMKSQDDNCRVQTTNEVSTRQAKSPHNNQSLKPNDCNASESPKTYSDYIDLIQTLPEKEREKFLKFCEKRASALPRPVQMIDKWIAANFDWLKNQFYKTTAKKAAEPQAEAQKKPDLTQEQDSIVRDLVARGEIVKVYYSVSHHGWYVLWKDNSVQELHRALSWYQSRESGAIAKGFQSIQEILKQKQAQALEGFAKAKPNRAEQDKSDGGGGDDWPELQF